LSSPIPLRVSPDTIVKLSWAISGKYTEGQEEKDTAQRAESLFNQIKQQLITNGLTSSIQYANEIESSLLSSSRIFAMIIRHRDLMFNSLEERRTNELDMYKSLQSFTVNLQSIFPRLSGIVIAGASLPALIEQTYSFFFPHNAPIPENVITLLVAAFGAIGYLIAEIGSSRTANKKMIQTKERYDNQKNIIYQDFLSRARRALEFLFDDLILAYRANIDANYSISEVEKKSIIDSCVAASM
jgi:hypothetical protein